MCKDKITEEGIFLPGLHSHCHQVDDLTRFRAKQRTSQNLVRIGVHHYLEESVRIAQSPGTRNGGYRQLVDLYIQSFLRASASLSPMRESGGSMNTE